jgi:hypothetical protein
MFAGNIGYQNPVKWQRKQAGYVARSDCGELFKNLKNGGASDGKI